MTAHRSPLDRIYLCSMCEALFHPISGNQRTCSCQCRIVKDNGHKQRYSQTDRAKRLNRERQRSVRATPEWKSKRAARDKQKRGTTKFKTWKAAHQKQWAKTIKGQACSKRSRSKMLKGNADPTEYATRLAKQRERNKTEMSRSYSRNYQRLRRVDPTYAEKRRAATRKWKAENPPRLSQYDLQTEAILLKQVISQKLKEKA